MRDIFNHKNKLFDGTFPSNCQTRSVPASLKALVSMILDGPYSSKSDVFHEVSANTASLSISQLISFNCTCVKRRTTSTTDDDSKPAVRHNKERETPLPIYAGLKTHAETRNITRVQQPQKISFMAQQYHWRSTLLIMTAELIEK